MYLYMKRIIESFKKWKHGKNEDYQRDEIKDFANKLDSGDLLSLFETIENHEKDLKDLYRELKGLLKENTPFPKQLDTDARLCEWLMKKGEL